MRILHLFNWEIKNIIKELPNIASQGFDAIQINPIQPLKEDGLNIEWWKSYQPTDFRIGNQYGSKEDLIRLCYTAKSFDIKIIQDVVLNHLANDNNDHLKPHKKVPEYLKNNPFIWKEKRNIKYWKNRWEVINLCMDLPGLQHKNHDLQKVIINFLNDLTNCGISGFRFDAAKNIATPEEGCDFWENIIKSISSRTSFNYAEIIFETPRIKNNYSKYFNVLCEHGDINPDKLVRFAESHDSYLEFKNTKNKSEDIINMEYQSINNRYRNTIYYARPFSNAWKSPYVKIANTFNKFDYDRKIGKQKVMNI